MLFRLTKRDSENLNLIRIALEKIAGMKISGIDNPEGPVEFEQMKEKHPLEQLEDEKEKRELRYNENLKKSDTFFEEDGLSLTELEDRP